MPKGRSSCSKSTSTRPPQPQPQLKPRSSFFLYVAVQRSHIAHASSHEQRLDWAPLVAACLVYARYNKGIVAYCDLPSSADAETKTVLLREHLGPFHDSILGRARSRCLYPYGPLHGNIYE